MHEEFYSSFMSIFVQMINTSSVERGGASYNSMYLSNNPKDKSMVSYVGHSVCFIILQESVRDIDISNTYFISFLKKEFR